MPIPWKKSKFSRIVADHLNSAKQGGSLVVETGFPTSLVDLFVKNRDGLKRSSKKKKKDRRLDVEPIVPPQLCHGYTISPARSVSSPESFYNISTPSPTISRTSSFSSSPAIWRTPPRHSFSDSGSPIRGIGLSSVGDENEVADAKGVFFAILKVFFVVALALGTKQFVVGLIISAFSLIFMEFIGRYYLCRLLKPCQHAQISLGHFFEQVKRIQRPRENQIEEEEPSSSMKETRISKPSNHLKPPRGKDTTRTISSSRSFHLKPESDQELPIGGNLTLSHCRSLNWLSEEMDRTTQIKDSHKNQHHRNGKIKSKIIKLLSSKKKEEIEDPITDSDQKISSKSRSSRLKSKIKKIVVPSSKKKQQQQQQQQTNEQQNNPLPLPDFLRIEEPIVCYSEEQSCTSPTSRSMPKNDFREDTASVSTEIVPEERRVDCGGKTMRSRGFCFVLLPIILVGLMGGRFWAVAFTLAWCLIWKLTGMLWIQASSSSSSILGRWGN